MTARKKYKKIKPNEKQKQKLTKVHSVRSRYHMAMWLYYGKAPWEKFSLEPTLESWQTTGWPNVRRHSVPDACSSVVLSYLYRVA